MSLQNGLKMTGFVLLATGLAGLASFVFVSSGTSPDPVESEDHEQTGKTSTDGDDRTDGSSDTYLYEPLENTGIADELIHHDHPGECHFPPEEYQKRTDRGLPKHSIAFWAVSSCLTDRGWLKKQKETNLELWENLERNQFIRKRGEEKILFMDPSTMSLLFHGVRENVLEQ